MSAVNMVMLVGRVGQDPEMRTFQTGTMKSDFTLAVRRGREEVDWIPVSVWGKTAEFVSKHVKKGSLLSVTGELKMDQWEKDGKRQSRLVVIGGQVNLLAGKSSIEGRTSSDEFGIVDHSEEVDHELPPF